MPDLIPVGSHINTPPYPAIARLKTARRSAKRFYSLTYYHGTGALINGKYLLTAGHNLYQNAFTSLRTAKIKLGYNDGHAIWEDPNIYRSGSTRVADGFRFHRYNKDYAIIKMKANAPAQHYFRLPEPGEITRIISEKKLPLFLGGYPGSEGHNGHKLMYSSTLNYSQHGSLLDYDIDTATGNSGGPVWFTDNNEHIIAGVHVKGTGVNGGSSVIVDNEVLNEINSWIKED